MQVGDKSSMRKKVESE
jgi:hypothetical protein